MVRPSSLKGPKAPNNFLRKHRKWPLSPYKTKWHQTFNQQQAMQTLKQAAAAATTTVLAAAQENPIKHQQPHLLSTLVHSFNTYNCDPTPSAYHYVLKTLARTSQFHHIPLVLDRLERVEKFQTPEYVFTELIQIYSNADKLQEAVDLFYGIDRFRCVPSVYSLNSLLSVLCRKSEGLRMVPQVLLKSQFMNIRVEESTFRILVSALCRVRRVGYAIEILNCMINDGYELNVRICSLILSSLCEQRDLSRVEVMGFVERMRKLGFCPGMKDYSNVIRFLVRGGKGLDALEVLNRMKVDGIKPDIFCYTMVINGVILEGDYGKADELFDELLVLGLVPDVYTYNVYIFGMCKQNNVEAGIKMIASMEELGCKPNVITYNTIMDALCKVGKLSRMRELVKDMGWKGVEFNLRTYRIMLEGFVGKGEIIEACALSEEMLEKCFCPRCAAFDEIIFGLCQKGLVCKAVELIKKMIGKNVVPGPMAWEALLLSAGSKLSFSETILTGLVNGEPNVNSPI
jgi:pentatricopeptide repeat protein